MDASTGVLKSGIFHLKLICTARSTTTIKSLALDSLPSCTLDLKKEIQAQLSIPVCVQALSYQAAVLADNDSFETKHIRSGDTISVRYLCEGDCEQVGKVIDWVRQLIGAISSEDDDQLEQVTASGASEDLDVSLALTLFDWLDPRSYVNKIFFEWIGGLDALLNLYRSLLQKDWGGMSTRLKYLEGICTQSIANFAETFPLRRLLLQRGILEACVQSFLRVRLRKGMPVYDEVSIEGSATVNNYLLQRVIENSLHIICNLSEMPECQVQLASQADVLQQTICVSLSETYSCATSVLVSEVFLCLAHAPEAHQYLVQHDVIDGLIDAYRVRPLLIQDLNRERILLVALRCFSLVVLAQLILVSPHQIPRNFLGTIHTYMEKFLDSASIGDIVKYEEDQMCVWATLLPYLKLLYLPNAPGTFPNDASLSQLQLLSLNTVLFFLHSKIVRGTHREVLLREGLLDFVSCMPWHVPVVSRDKAVALLRELGRHVRLEPPRLCNIAKAKLAKTHFGLERVAKVTSVGEIFKSVYP